VRASNSLVRYTHPVDRHFPDRVSPTPIAGLPDDSVAFPVVGKLSLDAIKQALACHQAVVLSETAFIPAFGAGKSKPSGV